MRWPFASRKPASIKREGGIWLEELEPHASPVNLLSSHPRTIALTGGATVVSSSDGGTATFSDSDDESDDPGNVSEHGAVGVDQFAAGTSSALTAGLSDRLREKMYGQTATRNHQGALYTAGQVVGTGMGLALGVASPCTMASGPGMALRGINALQAAGNSMNAYENWQKGNILGAALDAAGVLGNVSNMLKACFAARTPLLTLEGSEFIENIKEGDYVLARDENDPDGPVLAKRVEEVFRNYAPIWHVHLGAQVIRTTGAHPFWVRGLGWTAAENLAVGDELSSHNGQWVKVDDLLHTGEWDTVYNIRVAEFHTYFVGCQAWGFSAWAHNACSASGRYTEPTLPDRTIVNQRGIKIEHYFRGNDHPPAHLHVVGGGPPVRIGANGNPIYKGEYLTPAQKDVVQNNLSKIRSATNKIRAWLKYTFHLADQ